MKQYFLSDPVIYEHKKRKIQDRKIKSEDNILYKHKEHQINFFGYNYDNSNIGDTVALYLKNKLISGILYEKKEGFAGVIITLIDDNKIKYDRQKLIWIPWHTIRIPRCKKRSFDDCSLFQLKRLCFEKNLPLTGVKKEIIARLRKKVNIKDFSHLKEMYLQPSSPFYGDTEEKKKYDNVIDTSKNLCHVIKNSKCTYPDVRREFIRQEMTDKYGPITNNNCKKTLNRDSFQYLLLLYDKYFFNNILHQIFKFKIKIKWSSNLKDANAQTEFDNRTNSVEISLNYKLLRKVRFFDDDDYLVESSIEIHDFLTLIQVIFEHELVHALFFTFCIDNKKNLDEDDNFTWKFYDFNEPSGHTNLFMSIVYNLFAHTDFTSFPYEYRNKEKTQLGQINYHKIARVGDLVYFFKDNILLTGTVTGKVEGSRTYCKIRCHDTKENMEILFSSITQIKGQLCNYLTKKHFINEDIFLNETYDDSTNKYTEEIMKGDYLDQFSERKNPYKDRRLLFQHSYDAFDKNIAKRGDQIEYWYRDTIKKGLLWEVKDNYIDILMDNSNIVTIPWELVKMSDCSDRILSNCSIAQLTKLCKKYDIEPLKKKKNIILSLATSLLKSNHMIKVYDYNERYPLAGVCKVFLKEQIQYPDVRRLLIHDILKKKFPPVDSTNFREILTPKFFSTLYLLYDKVFFDNLFHKNGFNINIGYEDENAVSGLVGNDAFTHVVVKPEFVVEIKINATKLEKVVFTDDDFIVEGSIEITDFLTYIQITFEHELIHAIMDAFCSVLSQTDMMQEKVSWIYKSDADSNHSNAFMSMIHNIFGHVDFRGSLFEYRPKKKKSKLTDAEYLGKAKKDDIIYWWNDNEDEILIGKVELVRPERYELVAYEFKSKSFKLVYFDAVFLLKGSICNKYNKIKKESQFPF